MFAAEAFWSATDLCLAKHSSLSGCIEHKPCIFCLLYSEGQIPNTRRLFLCVKHRRKLHSKHFGGVLCFGSLRKKEECLYCRDLLVFRQEKIFFCKSLLGRNATFFSLNWLFTDKTQKFYKRQKNRCDFSVELWYNKVKNLQKQLRAVHSCD